MFFNSKSILKDLKSAYNQSLKDKDYCDFIYILNHSSSKANDHLFCTYGLINNLTIKNLGNFLKFSNPKVMFNDDLVEFSVNGKSYGIIDIENLTSLQYKDFLPELLDGKKNGYEVNLDLTISLVEKGQLRIDFENNMESFVESYCKFWDKECSKLLKAVPNDNTIYHFVCESNEMEVVYDGFNSVAYGNSWDFHPGCHGLESYKGLKLSNWRGAGSLASILSAGLKKKMVYKSVTQEEFEMLNGSPAENDEKNDHNSDKVLIESLVNEAMSKKEVA